MVPPSLSETQSASGVKLTPATRSSALNTKSPVPNFKNLLGFYRIALILVQEYTKSRNSDPSDLPENQPTAEGRCLAKISRLRVRVETPAPPAIGKERFTGNVQISGLRLIPMLDSGGFVLGPVSQFSQRRHPT